MTEPARDHRPDATCDLDARDPDYIRETLPILWLFASVWHRAEVRGLDNIPDAGPVLLVGNHSGGLTTPDAPVFAVAFSTYYGVERPIYLLTHDVMLRIPGASVLRRWGMIPASRANTKLALRSGATVLVFPGGDYDACRPTSKSATIDFGGRKGFIDAALESGAPIVPVVSIGAQETQLFLSRGERIARLSPFSRRFRATIYPVSFGLPFGFSIAGFPPNLPLPSKITTEVLEPLHLRRRFGSRPDRDEVYDHVTAVMQEAMDALAAERRFPILG
ncbi:MAG: lysophospholipid acyltransferase family protein [Acidimicrobiia bacterium]|jgi:1-acyl-sn-glycerol-3-phosphate acyltransferase